MIYALLPPANEVWGKVIFLHLSVILFIGGGFASVHVGIPPPCPLEQTPKSRHPPRADTPLGQTTPLAQCMLGDTVNKRAVCILLECNLVTKYENAN